jgi:hypothetical protein
MLGFLVDNIPILVLEFFIVHIIAYLSEFTLLVDLEISPILSIGKLLLTVLIEADLNQNYPTEIHMKVSMMRLWLPYFS